MSDATTGTTATAVPSVPADVLLSQIDVALKRLSEKHWREVEEVMVRQGFAPKDGGIYVLPRTDEGKTPGYRPDWVRFSDAVTGACLVNPRAAGLMP